MAETVDQPRWIAGVKPSDELLAMNGIQVLEYEFRQQPGKLRELIAAYGSDDEIRGQLRYAHDIAGSTAAPVIFIGMGGSLCASIAATAHLQANARLAFAVDAGEWLHYAHGVWKDAALSVLLTTSGESAELVTLIKEGTGGPLALICNNPASTCWQLAKHRLPILAGPEYGNATKTYTNTTAAGIILASETLGRAWKQDAEREEEFFSHQLESIFASRGELESFCRGSAN